MRTSYLERERREDVMISRLLERRAADRPDDVYFTVADDTFTCGDFNRLANQMARNLLSARVVKGTRVALLMDSSPDYLTLWFALSKIGAVEITINTAYIGEILRYQLALSEASVCIVDRKYLAAVRRIRDELPALESLIVRGSVPLADGDEAESPADLRGFDDALRRPADDSNLDVELAPDDLCGVIFTSGTTGLSKGVMLNNYFLACHGHMYAEINDLRSDDVIFNFLPFFHMGAKFLAIAPLVSGGAMRLQDRFRASSFLDDVVAHGITNFLGVGSILNILLTREAPSYPHIRTIYAVPDPPDIHDELIRRFGCRITSVYGNTESGLPVFRGVHDEYYPRSAGRVSPYYDVIVADAEDNEVPPGTTGEILVRPRRPDVVSTGYMGDAARTLAARRNLWIHSGDLGHFDERGFLYFDDRKSDSIRRRGENISSFELESAVSVHPEIVEVAAIAAPSELGEDEVCLLVQLRDDSRLTEEEVFAHCAETLPYFMVPRYVELVTNFPRTPTAKVEKYRLRGAYPSPARWDRAEHGWTITRDGLARTAGSIGL
jgi:crotonobetaine/carnitine-CoA ligase